MGLTEYLLQIACNYLKKLDSRFHGNDGIWGFQTFYEFIKFDGDVIRMAEHAEKSFYIGGAWNCFSDQISIYNYFFTSATVFKRNNSFLNVC